jgi:putative ABC transport system permease protein
MEGVSDITPVYIFPAIWKNPWNSQRRSINAIGFDPAHRLLDTPGFEESRDLLRQQNVVLFDAASRPEFGDVPGHFAEHGAFSTEINDREMDVVGLFQMGTSFGIDGSVITSDDNWLRLFPERPRDEIQLGLIRLDDPATANDIRDRLQAYLPKDVLVMTRADFVQRETSYWNSATPIGYIFAFGAIMGLVVGAIIVYQILFADVSEHLREYATLRAIGYGKRFVSGIVLQQAAMLAVMGFVPGVLAVHWLYGKAAAATNLPLYLTFDRALTVFLLTLAMCAISGLLAMRKVQKLDPAEVF